MKAKIAQPHLGFTLIEALLAIGIFAAGMTMVVQLMRSTSRVALRCNLDTQAALRCESMIDEFLAMKSRAAAATIADRWSDDQWLSNLQLDNSEFSGVLCLRAACQARFAPDIAKAELSRLIPASFMRSAGELAPSLEAR